MTVEKAKKSEYNRRQREKKKAEKPEKAMCQDPNLSFITEITSSDDDDPDITIEKVTETEEIKKVEPVEKVEKVKRKKIKKVEEEIENEEETYVLDKKTYLFLLEQSKKVINQPQVKQQPDSNIESPKIITNEDSFFSSDEAVQGYTSLDYSDNSHTRSYSWSEIFNQFSAQEEFNRIKWFYSSAISWTRDTTRSIGVMYQNFYAMTFLINIYIIIEILHKFILLIKLIIL